MSIATEMPIRHKSVLKEIERDARNIAKEHGARVRRHPYSGIDVKFRDGEKKHYHGWMQLKLELIKVFGLAD